MCDQDLLIGYQKFREFYYTEHQAQYQNLARKGQAPKTLVISCADSRVDPETILQVDPGNLFAIRNVANLIPPYSEQAEAQCLSTEAGLNYAVVHLNIEHIIVLGHSQCGGIQALIDMEPDEYQSNRIYQWLAPYQETRRQLMAKYPSATHTELAEIAEKEALCRSYEHLLTYPYISERHEQKKLAIHLWHFDIESGTLHTYQADQQQFVPLKT